MKRTLEKVSALRSSKKRTLSSRNWLMRQLNDPYVIQSKALGYRSRSAFKLMDIDKKYKILKPKQTVIDLGCAPGGWLQVVQERVKAGIILGLDLQEVAPLEGVTLIQGDFSEDDTLKKLYDFLGGLKVDVVLSDMAASACGIPSVDHLRIIELAREVIAFCSTVMGIGGSIVAKVLHGGIETALLAEIKKQFRFVSHYKPPSSRQNSSEIYIIAQGYRKTTDSNS